MANIERVLNSLNKVRAAGRDKWLACCPAHDDKNPSLSISLVDDRVLFKCWSGCGGVDVMTATGLDMECFAPEGILTRQFNSLHSVFAKPREIISDDALVLGMFKQKRTDGIRLTQEEKAKEYQLFLREKRRAG